MSGLAHYILQVVIAFDQLVCAIAGGWADETVSSCLYRLDRDGKPVGQLLRPFVDAIAAAFGQRDHCRISYESERLRAQSPPEERSVPCTARSR